ncbi:MAG TPA: methyltransferase domain-containing protein [Sphingobacterium sp.]|nr:methyltransferase domain-containing protein [Sphingobacterium sp.]
MTKQRYDLEYLNKTTQVLESFKANSYQPFIGLTDGKIADIGCGAGDDIIRMAKLFSGADVQFIGVDHQQEMIDAGTLNSELISNVSFVLGDAAVLPFADNELSGLRSERLIQHLTDPNLAFAEFHRVLKLDCPIVIAETDWNSLSFYNGEREMIRKVREYFSNRNVNNGQAAVSLMQYVEQGGFRDIVVEVFPMTSYSLSQCIMMIRLDQVLVSMKNEGIINEQEERGFFEALQEADHAGHFVSTMNLIIVKAKK